MTELDEHIPDERYSGLEHVVTLDATIEGWPTEVKVFITHYDGGEYVVFVKLISLGIVDRDFVMRWVAETKTNPFPSWKFMQPMANEAKIPADLMELEEEIGDAVVFKDL